jgi:hypothetical protein
MQAFCHSKDDFRLSVTVDDDKLARTRTDDARNEIVTMVDSTVTTHLFIPIFGTPLSSCNYRITLSPMHSNKS